MYAIRDRLKYRAKVRTKSQSGNTGFTDGLRKICPYLSDGIYLCGSIKKQAVSRLTNARHPEGWRLLPKGRKNPKFFGGFCEKFFKPSTMWGKVWLGVGTLLRFDESPAKAIKQKRVPNCLKAQNVGKSQCLEAKSFFKANQLTAVNILLPRLFIMTCFRYLR